MYLINKEDYFIMDVTNCFLIISRQHKTKIYEIICRLRSVYNVVYNKLL